MLALVVLLAVGCGGAKTSTTSSVPASAKQAPADALAFVSLNTDLSSDQWTNAQALADLFPSMKATLTKSIDSALAAQKLDWKTDVEPALGPELVVVVTADSKPVILLQPADEAKLDHLLSLDTGTKPVKGKVGDWTALAQTQADIDAYSAALGRGTLDTVDTFSTAVAGLPADTLVTAWVDGAGLTENIGKVASAASSLGSGTSVPGLGLATGKDGKIDLGLDSIAMALSAKANGLFVAVDARGAKLGNGTHYKTVLFKKVPGDAVAALSFGGTQKTLDSLRGPLDKLSGTLESTLGVSLDRITSALSGEGVIYVRRGSGTVPEVTAVLSPPDANETLTTIDTLMHKLAAQTGSKIQQVTMDDVSVSRLELNGVPLSYGKLDADTVIVTTGSDAIASFNGSSERLADSDAFKRAATEVQLGDETTGFVYVDLDGLIPLITGLTGPNAIPADARAALEKLDSFILQSTADGDGTHVSGFVAVNK